MTPTSGNACEIYGYKFASDWHHCFVRILHRSKSQEKKFSDDKYGDFVGQGIGETILIIFISRPVCCV
jgi:hypothetical protein